MNRCIISVLLLIVAFGLNAQKHDAVWVFGHHAGLDFSQPDTVIVFETLADNHELNASISKANGELLGYIVMPDTLSGTFTDTGSVLNSTSAAIFSPLISQSSFADGAVFLPLAEDSNAYVLLHLAHRGGITNNPRLYISNYYFNETSNTFEYTQPPVMVMDSALEERISAIRHANGKDWWIIVHEAYRNQVQPQIDNKFFVFHLENGQLSSPNIYNSGAIFGFPVLGEISSSSSGDKFAIGANNNLEVFKFNRCTGQVEIIDSQTFPTNEIVYSIEFSLDESNLFLSTVNYQSFPGLVRKSEVLLVALAPEGYIDNSQSLISITDTLFEFSQLELALDGKIYVANAEFIYNGNGGVGVSFDSIGTHMSVIHNPNAMDIDSIGFAPFSLFLGDSISSSRGLPNFPNYRLGPLSIYTTSAALDTTFCIEDTTLPATLTLGQPDTSNLQYTWWPQDSFANPNLAQQTIILPQGADTLQYILTIGDSTITNACTTRDDTVTIILKSCKDDTVGIPQIAQQNLSYTLRPTLIKGQMSALVTLGAEERGQVLIYNLQGQTVYGEVLGAGTNTLPVGRQLHSAGLYIYQVWVNGELKTTDKLVKTQ